MRNFGQKIVLPFSINAFCRLKFPALFLVMWLLGFPYSQGQIAFWQHFLGGTRFDQGKRIMLRPDGTLILAGETLSTDGIGIDNHGKLIDIFVGKYATQGSFFWQKNLGGSKMDELGDIVETRDGGFVLIGTTTSSDGDVPANQGGSDIWVVKLDLQGDIEWSKTYGGRGDDRGITIVPLEDGGYLIGGESSSNNGDMQSIHNGGLDSWVAKITSQGRLLWERHYGGSANEKVCRMHPLPSGDFLIINSSDSPIDETQYKYGRKDVWLIKINPQGELLWQSHIGGEDNDDVHGSVMDKAGNIIIAGTTFSQKGNFTETKGLGDMWLFKISAQGDLLWSKTFGGPRADGANQVRIGKDGNYLLCGLTWSEMGDIRRNEGYYDGWIAKIDTLGKLLWSRTIGFKEKDVLNDVFELAEGGYLAIGYSVRSEDNFVQPGHHGSGDLWVANFGDPQKGLDVKPYRTPPLLVGKVKDKNTKKPLASTIILTDNTSLDSLGSTQSERRDGAFVLLLPAYGLTSINVLAKDYLFFGEDILMDTVIDKTMIEAEIELEPIQIGSSLILKNISFDVGKWDLLPSSYAELERVVAFMKLNPRVVIQISGHTDNTGNKAQKVELSRRRALAVQEYLVKKGIMEIRTRVKGYGMYRPIASNSTPEGRRKNRRVEFEVINK